MSIYGQIIQEATNCPAADIARVEDYMRHTIFCSTLGSKTRAELQKASREAWEDIQYMRSPDGQAYVASLLPANL